MIRTTIRQYCLLLVLNRCGMGMISAVYASFLILNGLNLLQVNLVNLVFFVTLFICEIPTGAFADVFGRKLSFVVSCVTYTIGMMIYGVSKTFWGFALAEILAAIATTFMSGAFEAWLVDSLKHHGYRKPFSPLFAKASQLGTGAGLLAALSGAILFDLAPSLPWFIGSFFFSSAGIIGLIVMKEEYFVKNTFSLQAGLKSLKDTIRSSIEFGIRDKKVRFIMLLVLSLNFSTMAPNMQWQPYFKAWLPNQAHMGLLWAGMALSLMLGAWLAPKLLQHTNERRALILCQIMIAAGISGTIIFASLMPALVLFLAHEVARGTFGPIKSAYLHDNIPSRERATVVSFESISHHIGGAIGLATSGVIAHFSSIPIAWSVSGLALLLTAIFFWKNGR